MMLLSKTPSQYKSMYEKFHRAVSLTPIGDRYHVYYESGNTVIERRMNKSFPTKEAALEAIAALDKEIEEAQ